jgi:glycerol-3-phosphate dehydrogenase
MANKQYDVLVIGGGIYGANVAREAAFRGLSAALVEQGDFGHGTSANSHKILHGGLRYLQHGDFRRMRESIRERRNLFRMAPHLVDPMPVLVPIYRRQFPGKLAMAAALKINDLISFDRNRSLEPSKAMPPGRMLDTAECLERVPGLDAHDLVGGALFHDGQLYNPDRLILSILWSASQAGADLANYVRVTGFLQERGTLIGVRARDVLAQKAMDIRANIIVNCSGPWMNGVLRLTGDAGVQSKTRFLKAVVLVTRPVTHGIALGVPGIAPYRDRDAVVDKGRRFFFIAPWRNASLVGTFQVPHEGEGREPTVTEQEISTFMNEVNAAYPGAGLKRDDLRFAYAGLIPCGDDDRAMGNLQLLKRYKLIDHARDGLDGVISVVGVKFTTARGVAEKAIDLVFRKMGRRPLPSTTATSPVDGGEDRPFDGLHDAAAPGRPGAVPPEVLGHLTRTYGSRYRDILNYGAEQPAWLERVIETSPVIKAEVVHGVRAEMATALGDVIFRRTELGTAGYPGDRCLETCAGLMANELGWGLEQTRREIEQVRAVYTRLGCLPQGVEHACAFS